MKKVLKRAKQGTEPKPGTPEYNKIYQDWYNLYTKGPMFQKQANAYLEQYPFLKTNPLVLSRLGLTSAVSDWQNLSEDVKNQQLINARLDYLKQHPQNFNEIYDPQIGVNIPDAKARGLADPLNWPLLYYTMRQNPTAGISQQVFNKIMKSILTKNTNNGDPTYDNTDIGINHKYGGLSKAQIGRAHV